MRITIITASLCTALAVAACGENEVLDPSDLAQDPTTGVPAGKADCPNCDESGPNAFIQAGLETRWYRPGDKWHVAFQFRNRGMMGKEDFLRPTANDEWTRSGVFLFEYEARRTGRDAFETSTGSIQRRDTVEIHVDQVDPDEVGFGGAGYFETERVDRHQHAVSFRMNDLTDALDVTYYDRNYPNGKTVRAPSKSALSLPGSVFPVNVPRLLRGGADVIAPTLPMDLKVIADSLDAGWVDRAYKRFDFANGDVVYWAKGYLWPFYIVNDQGRGLLLDGRAL